MLALISRCHRSTHTKRQFAVSPQKHTEVVRLRLPVSNLVPNRVRQSNNLFRTHCLPSVHCGFRFLRSLFRRCRQSRPFLSVQLHKFQGQKGLSLLSHDCPQRLCVVASPQWDLYWDSVHTCIVLLRRFLAMPVVSGVRSVMFCFGSFLFQLFN